MKPQITTCLNLLVIIVLLSTVLTGCSKKDDDSPDFASAIAGTYTGTVTVSGIGTTSGSTTITRVSETKVNMIVAITGTQVPLNGINVSSPSSNTYSLSFSDSSGSLSGTVSGLNCNWTMTGGGDVVVFSGTR